MSNEKITLQQPFLLKPKRSQYPEIAPVPTFRQSGHYLDQKLKSSHGKQQQLSLWDALLPETKEGSDIKRFESYKEDIVVEGIRLSTREENTVNALLQILNSESGGTLAGTVAPDMVPFGGEQREAPKLAISFHKLAEKIHGPNYSGKELALVSEAIDGLAEKRFLISYRRLKVSEKGEKTFDIIEEYLPLLKIVSIHRDISEEEAEKKTYRSKGEMVLRLNPLFTDQIDTKFIVFPEDINRRTAIAAESRNGRYPEAIIRLRDYLIREISSGHTKPEINADKLPYQLGLDKYIAEGRRKLIKETTEKAFKAVKALGLVESIEETTGAQGQKKYVFHLNKDWM
jgi:hypothetical protein